MIDILDKIDAAVGCHQCHGPLGVSPSDDFCSEDCQNTWRADRVGATPEPAYGLFQVLHNMQRNLHRFHARALGDSQPAPVVPWALATTNAHTEVVSVAQRMHEQWVEAADQVTFSLTPDLDGFSRAMSGAAASMGRFADSLRGYAPNFTAPTRQRVMQRALEARRSRNTGPASRRRNGRIL